LVLLQDAEELLQVLLEIITQELSAPAKGQESSRARARGFKLDTDGRELLRAAGLGPPGAFLPFQVPLTGWLASTLQCSTCLHKKPVQNSTFIDISLPLPESGAGGPTSRGGMLNGARSAWS
jgi:hypothetical protein